MTVVLSEGVSPALEHGSVVIDRMQPVWTERHNPYGLDLNVLAGMAVRDNPKRAQLIVSRVLGKHVPALPSAVRATGLLLERRSAVLSPERARPRAARRPARG